jgi:hypothetical protein
MTLTIRILDIIHRPFFYLKHDVSETGFCLRLQVISIQFVPIGIVPVSGAGPDPETGTEQLPPEGTALLCEYFKIFFIYT